MRVWLPTTRSGLEQLRDQGEFAPVAAFGLTPQWCAQFEDQDPEVLADAALHERHEPVVVVAEVPAAALPGAQGLVQVTGTVATSAVQAIFVRSGPDYLWYGPSELGTAVAAAPA